MASNTSLSLQVSSKGYDNDHCSGFGALHPRKSDDRCWEKKMGYESNRWFIVALIFFLIHTVEGSCFCLWFFLFFVFCRDPPTVDLDGQ